MRRVPDNANVLVEARVLRISDGTLLATSDENLQLTITEPDGTSLTPTIPRTEQGTYQGVVNVSKTGVNKIEAETTEGTRNINGATRVRVVDNDLTRRIVREPGDRITFDISPWDSGTADDFDSATMTITGPDGTKVVDARTLQGANGQFSGAWDSDETATPGTYEARFLLTDSVSGNDIALERTFILRSSQSF